MIPFQNNFLDVNTHTLISKGMKLFILEPNVSDYVSGTCIELPLKQCSNEVIAFWNFYSNRSYKLRLCSNTLTKHQAGWL